MSVHEKLSNQKRPHKLLALDGGGIRGLITLEVLSRIETLLQKKHSVEMIPLSCLSFSITLLAPVQGLSLPPASPLVSGSTGFVNSIS